MKVKVSTYYLILLLAGCQNDEKGILPQYYSCHNSAIISGCGNENAPYCTYGYKFGDSNPYTPNGLGVSGPQKGNITISFKFMSPGQTFQTLYQNNASSLSFSAEDKSQIRNTISKWSSVANFNFIEKTSEEDSDIVIASAFIPTGSGTGSTCGLGHPNYDLEPCKKLSGLLVLNPKCSSLVPIVLHEMGHVLGLGHSASGNVMYRTDPFFSELQAGDIQGIQSIYGSK
jgi:hypothetical protein